MPLTRYLIFCWTFFSLPLFAQSLTYTISPVFLSGTTRLRVEVAFKGESTGIAFLKYDDNQFGVPDQMACLSIPDQASGITVTKSPANNQLEIKHQPGVMVKVVYEISDLQGNQPFYEYCCYKPIINKNYFHIQSGHLCAVPESYWTSPKDLKTVQFVWKNFPQAYTVHNSFGPDMRQTATITQSQFSSAVFVGGDFRRHQFQVHDQPVYFLTRGQWSLFSDDTLVHLLRTTVEGHRTFWNDFADTIYSVTFLPIDNAPWSDTSRFVSAGGSGLTNSFLSYGTNNPGLSYGLVRYIYVHELMHRWIGIKIENAHEEQQYWFSEGFTEYYTLKNMLRYGLITTEEWVNNFNNDFVTEHYASPKRLAPNDSINYTHFWSGDKDWEKLPYRRGCLYAFYLDNQLREKSKGQSGLDDLMRHILVAMEQDPGKKLDHVFFKKILKKRLGKKGVRDFEKYIEQGVLIDFTQTPLPKGLQATVRDRTVNYGPSAEVITHSETFKQIPSFEIVTGTSVPLLKEQVLR